LDLLPNPDVVHSTYRWLAHAAHGVSEVRVIRPAGGIAGIGFFDDEDAFVRECCRTNALGNVYAGIQPRPRRMLDLARNAIRPLRQGAGRKDIEWVTATVIDLDPVRPKDQASTDDELRLAIDAAMRAADWCEAQGFARPRLMMSGNGVQLWLAVPPVALGPENREMVQANLRQLEAEIRAEVESDAVKVDSIHDVSRIIKVIGTVSRKGVPSPERPHRVSAPLSDLDRVEDERLAARLTAAVVVPAVAKPALAGGTPAAAPPVAGSATARRTEDGMYDWRSPVEMCGPVQRLWNEGHRDRSLAIFDMVRFFAHKGFPLGEITDLILEYDRRGLQKLVGRDGPAYVRSCYDKVMGGVRDDGTVPPPCHSLQKIGYCPVNREPGARCDVFDVVFDVGRAIEALPADVPKGELQYRLRPILDAIADAPPGKQAEYVRLLAERSGLEVRALEHAVQRTGRRARSHESGERGDGDDPLEGEIFEDLRCYYTVTGRGEIKVISSFTVSPDVRVTTADGELFMGTAQASHGGRVRGIQSAAARLSLEAGPRPAPTVGGPPVDGQRQQRPGPSSGPRAEGRAAVRRLDDARRGDARGPAAVDRTERDHRAGRAAAALAGRLRTERLLARAAPSVPAGRRRCVWRGRPPRLREPAPPERPRGPPAHPGLVLRDAPQAAPHGVDRLLPVPLHLGQPGVRQELARHRRLLAALRDRRLGALQRNGDGVRAHQDPERHDVGSRLHRRVQAL
jgi:hypothetical protein